MVSSLIRGVCTKQTERTGTGLPGAFCIKLVFFPKKNTHPVRGGYFIWRKRSGGFEVYAARNGKALRAVNPSVSIQMQKDMDFIF